MRGRTQILQSQQQRNKKQDNIFFALMDKVGSVGRYQTITFMVLCLIGYSVGGLSLMTPFIFYEDPYICKTVTGKSCLNAVCKMPIHQRQHHTPPPTIYSLANKFGDYRCSSAMVELTMVKSVMYGGCLLGFVCCFLLGDLIGGKTLMLSGLVMNLVGLLKVILSQSLIKSGFGLFFCLFGLTIANGISFVFITETVGQEKRQSYKIILASFYSLGGLLNVLWFYIAPNFETVLIIFYILPTILCIICFIFLFKDTPVTLISKRNPEEALKDLKMIAKINKKKFNMTVEDVKEMQLKYRQQYLQSQENSVVKSFTVVDLFRYPSLRPLILSFTILDCILNLQFFTPTLILDQLNFSIFLTGFVVESAQLISGVLSYFLIYRIERRRMAIGSFGVIAFCSLILLVLWDQSGKEPGGFFNRIVVLFFIFVIEFAISNQFNFYCVYLNQVLPTQVRIIGIGFIKTFGAGMVMSTPAIITWCVTSGFPLMLLFGVLAGLSAWCSYILPESLGKRPAEVIDELREEGRAIADKNNLI